MTYRIILTLLAAATAAPAAAELPDPVRDMIEAAMASGDADKVKAVVEVARETNPEDVGEIDAMLASFRQEQAALEAARKETELAELRRAGVFDNWSGSGEIGGFRASGNSDNTGLSAGLKLERKGVDWSHKLVARADYQRSNGITSREQFFGSYEPHYNISERLFTYGLAQYERDRFQGFSARYAFSGGLGYHVIDAEDLSLSVKAGPAYRITRFAADGSESRLAALMGLDFDWDITERLKLTHDTNAVAETGGSATVIVDSANTSLNLVTGLNAKISDSLSARVSYAVEYDSDPPAGAVKTDTLTRFTLVYGF